MKSSCFVFYPSLFNLRICKIKKISFDYYFSLYHPSISFFPLPPLEAVPFYVSPTFSSPVFLVIDFIQRHSVWRNSKLRLPHFWVNLPLYTSFRLFLFSACLPACLPDTGLSDDLVWKKHPGVAGVTTKSKSTQLQDLQLSKRFLQANYKLCR